MKKYSLTLAAVAATVAGLAFTAPVHAANGYVVVVAEGVSPEIVNLGKAYIQKADEDTDATTSFEDAMKNGKAAPVGANTVGDLKGLLETAEKNGYKTGLVTTGDVTQVAPLFYDLPGDAAADLTAANAKYDFLAGGGRAHFANAGAALTGAGGTYISKSDDLDGELKGRILITQTDGELDYNIDRDPEVESGLGELASVALDTLSADDKPFVLVIHDTLIKKAIATKDTPALFDQFREVNNILADAIARRDDSPNLKVAAVWTGGDTAPRFQAGADQSNAFYTISNLGRSYVGVGATLKGADVATITDFANPDDGQYRGWKLTEADKSAIAAGTLSGEAAARATYESYLKLDYVPATSAAGAYTLGFDASAGLIPTLQAAVAKPAK